MRSVMRKPSDCACQISATAFGVGQGTRDGQRAADRWRASPRSQGRASASIAFRPGPDPLSCRHSGAGAIVRYFSLPAVSSSVIWLYPAPWETSALPRATKTICGRIWRRPRRSSAGRRRIVGTRGGETKIAQLLGAPRGLARRLHRRDQQSCVTDRQDLFRVEQLAEYRSQLLAIPNIRNAFAAKKLLDALNGNSRPLEEKSCCLPVA